MNILSKLELKQFKLHIVSNINSLIESEEISPLVESLDENRKVETLRISAEFDCIEKTLMNSESFNS